MLSKNTRMSIDISKKDHKFIKILALAEGKTLREFVIGCIHEKISQKKYPNKKTAKAIEDARNGNISTANGILDLYEQIGI